MAETKGMVRYAASDGSEVKLSPAIVARYIVTGDQRADDREVFAFMAKCQARRLNPLAGDAYMTVFKGKASVIVSKDYFVRTATQQPGFDGMRAGVVVATRDGGLQYREGCIVGSQTEKLVGGWAEVWDKGRKYPSRAEVSLSEYNTGLSVWKTKPSTMIRKVALVQALREAYPGAYGGIYDADEMPEPDVPFAPPEPVVAASEPEPVPATVEPEQPAGAAEPAYEPQEPEGGLADADYEF